MNRTTRTGDVELEVPLPLDREDGAPELDLRTTFQILFTDPAARNFTFAALGSIAMIFLILLQQGSDLGALLVGIIGTCGVLFRWTGAPAFVLLFIAYFMITPTGFPGDAFENRYAIEESYFFVTDIMLVLSVLVYIACHYRIIGFAHQAVPFEAATRLRGEIRPRRPAAIISSRELAILFVVAMVMVILGQLIWWFANRIEVVPAADFPLRLGQPRRSYRPSDLAPTPGGLSPGATRFVLIVGMLFFGTLLARLVFGYWRLKTMNPAEGGMILLDGGWSETSRERQRQEKWRLWGRNRTERTVQSAAIARNRRES